MNGRACVFVRASAVRMCTVPVGGLGMNGRACSFVRASAVRMCTIPVPGLGMVAYSLPGGVYGQNLYWACALHFHVCTCGTVRCSAWAVRAVYLICVCVCTAVGMCSPSVVPLAVSTCMRALYSIWYGGLGGVGSIHECYLHVCTVCVPLEQCWAWLVRAMYLSCSCLYCACTIVQCVLCWYSLYSVLAWPARVMYLLTRVCTRTVLVPSHSVYCACTPCTVIRHGQHGQYTCVLCLYLLYSGLTWPARVMYILPVFVLVLCVYYCTVCTVRVPLEQWFSVASTSRVPIGPCLYSYCGCTIAQCVLCLYLLYSGLAWPARVMYI